MSKVIEIYDSDEEMPQIQNKLEQVPSPPRAETPSISEKKDTALVVASGSVSPPPLIISEVTSINTSFLPRDGDDQSSLVTTEPSSASVISTPSTVKAQHTKRSRRKSMHHPLCANPEIEFETIALDDEEGRALTKSKNKSHSSINAKSDGVQESKSQKPINITSNISSSKVSTINFEPQISKACDEFMNSADTTALLRQIAEDRVRINFLLASYNMPEIQFSLHTRLEVLQFQLDERIKNRRNRFIDISTQLKKRLNVLQKHAGRTSN